MAHDRANGRQTRGERANKNKGQGKEGNLSVAIYSKAIFRQYTRKIFEHLLYKIFKSILHVLHTFICMYLEILSAL